MSRPRGGVVPGTPVSIPLPVSANPGDGRIFDADGKILCWMGGAGLFEDPDIISRRDEIVQALNAGRGDVGAQEER